MIQAVPIQLPAEAEALADWLLSEPWPFHVQSQVNRQDVLARIAKGHFSGDAHQSFWLASPQELYAGFLRLFDLDDIADGGYPMFDLRLRSACRGQGLGEQALKWLTRYVFETWPELDRIAGSTRADNLPMRRVFRKCGYVKEGHYRQDWPAADGQLLDTVHYAILRADWLSNTTTPVHWLDE